MQHLLHLLKRSSVGSSQPQGDHEGIISRRSSQAIMVLQMQGLRHQWAYDKVRNKPRAT